MGQPRRKDEHDHGTVREATPEEGLRLFDRAARSLLGISGPEFLHKWDRGEYRNSDDSDVFSVSMLIPFVRP